MWGVRVLVVVLATVACVAPNPRSCRDGLCTDQGFPFCDIDGALAGTPETCISVSCTANEFEACRGNEAITCNAAGNDYDLITCNDGCSPTTGCRSCSTNDQCGGATPVCGADGACRACAVDAECGSTVCEAGSCVPEAGILYVANSGDASAPCSKAMPCKIDRAITLAAGSASSPIIRLLPGVHSTGISVTFSTASPIRVVAADAHVVAANTVTATGGGRIDLRGGTFTATDTAFVCGDGASGALSSLKLRDLRVDSAGQAFATIRNGDVQLSASELITNVGDGGKVLLGYLGQLRADRIHMHGPGIGTLAFSYQFEARRVSVTVTNSLLENVVINVPTFDSAADAPGSVMAFGFNTIVVAQGYGGISCDMGSNAAYRRLVLDNNIVSTNGGLDSVRSNPVGCSLTSNLMFPQATAIAGNLIGDPGFVDAAGADYHLKAGSPAVDAAHLTLSFPTYSPDFEGKPRPQGASGDIGALERAP